MANHLKNILSRMSAINPVIACIRRARPVIHVLAFCSVLAVASPLALCGPQEVSRQDAGPDLVRVHVVAEIRGPKDALAINGTIVPGYSPRIIQAFSSTGIVLDNKGHVMSFLGYRWVGVQRWDPRFEIATADGQKFEGKLIGIDQGNGVAVLRLVNGNLKKTAVCMRCEIKDGAKVMTPVIGSPGPVRFAEAQVLSVGSNQDFLEQPGWIMKVNRPFPDVGQPILTMDNKVLGFIAGQDPIGRRTVVYSISELLSSSEKIIEANGDIRAGWLGVFLADSLPGADSEVVIQRVEQDSPARRAGLTAQDRLLRYNGRPIKDVRQFIGLVQNTAIGSKVNLEIERQGSPAVVTARIEARKPQKPWEGLSFNLPGASGPALTAMTAEPKPINPRLLIGLDIVVLTPALADAFQMSGQTGLLVVNVIKQTPADLAGVLVGDIVIGVDGQSFEDASNFAAYLQTRRPGAQLLLKVARKGIERTVAIRLPQ
jgi:serine protease Do